MRGLRLRAPAQGSPQLTHLSAPGPVPGAGEAGRLARSTSTGRFARKLLWYWYTVLMLFDARNSIGVLVAGPTKRQVEGHALRPARTPRGFPRQRARTRCRYRSAVWIEIGSPAGVRSARKSRQADARPIRVRLDPPAPGRCGVSLRIHVVRTPALGAAREVPAISALWPLWASRQTLDTLPGNPGPKGPESRPVSRRAFHQRTGGSTDPRNTREAAPSA